MSISCGIIFSQTYSQISFRDLRPSMSTSSRIVAALIQALVWLLDNACNNGFNNFLNPESSITLNGRPLIITNSKQAALRRGESIFAGTVLKSP